MQALWEERIIFLLSNLMVYKVPIRPVVTKVRSADPNGSVTSCIGSMDTDL